MKSIFFSILLLTTTFVLSKAEADLSSVDEKRVRGLGKQAKKRSNNSGKKKRSKVSKSKGKGKGNDGTSPLDALVDSVSIDNIRPHLATFDDFAAQNGDDLSEGTQGNKLARDYIIEKVSALRDYFHVTLQECKL